MVQSNTLTYTSNDVYYREFTIPKSHPTSYWKRIEELDFAIYAGDTEFSPAMKLILREALVLEHNARNYTEDSYRAAQNAVKSAYISLLDMNTQHPVATQLRLRFKRLYSDDIWNFIKPQSLAKKKADYGIVVSDGNITKNTYFIMKRLFDIVCATLLLIIFSPIILGMMIVIKAGSSGPVFFVQKRVGARRIHRAGMTVWQPIEFDFYKLRSMYHNADESVHRAYIQNWIEGTQQASEDIDALFKMRNDPRVTPIGRFIRKTSIDELPQLINVIKGNMSLVGPRPVPIYEVAGYKQKHYERLASVPGITGLWQIKGRGQTTIDEQLCMDVDYIYQQSMWRDFEILMGTPAAVIRGRGAC